MNKFTKITKNQIAEKGVQALSNRPNTSGQYGVGGLSAEQLKLWFDKLATLLADKINEIITALEGDAAASYIKVALENEQIEDLGTLIAAMTNGIFAARVLSVFPSATAEASVKLQKYINDAAAEVSRLWEAVNDRTPYIGENGNWFVKNERGEAIDTGVYSIGDPGVYYGAEEPADGEQYPVWVNPDGDEHNIPTPYDIAVEDGFEGTKAEWLETLKAPALEAAEEARRAIEELGDVMGGGAYPVLHLAYGENVTLPVNTECRLTLEGACAVTLGAEEEGYSSEWVLIVTQGETAYDLALPVIHWTLGIAPTFAAGTVTEIRLHYAGDTLEGVWNG